MGGLGSSRAFRGETHTTYGIAFSYASGLLPDAKEDAGVSKPTLSEFQVAFGTPQFAVEGGVDRPCPFKLPLELFAGRGWQV